MRPTLLALLLTSAPAFADDATADTEIPLATVATPAAEATSPTDAQGRAVPEVAYRAATTRVEPRFMASKEARALAKEGPLLCAIRVFVDEKGRPYEVRDEDCPDVLFPAAEKAVTQWRWDASEDGASQFVLRLAQYR